MRIYRRYLVFAATFVILSYMVLLLGIEVTSYLADEDGFFENLGAMAFLATSFLLIAAFFRSRRQSNRAALQTIKQLSYLALAFAMFFSAGEEVSWGQRIVGLDTPESIRAVNFQDEINIHNLDMFQITPENNLLRWMWHLFWLTFALGIPITAAVMKPGRQLLDRMIPIIPLPLGLIFLSNYLLWRVIYMTTPVDVYLNFPEEIMECNVAVLFLITAVWIIRESIPAGVTEIVGSGHSHTEK